MPDLTEAVVTAWLTDAHPAKGTEPSPPPIRAIEKEGAIPALLAELGRALDAAGESAPTQLCAALSEKRLCEQMRQTLAQLGSARTLRLISWLDERNCANAHEVVLALSRGADPEAQAIRAALALLTQGTALQRMFALERLATLERAATVAFTVKA